MDILGRSYMLHTSESLRVKSNVLLEVDVLKCFFSKLSERIVRGLYIDLFMLIVTAPSNKMILHKQNQITKKGLTTVV